MADRQRFFSRLGHRYQAGNRRDIERSLAIQVSVTGLSHKGDGPNHLETARRGEPVLHLTARRGPRPGAIHIKYIGFVNLRSGAPIVLIVRGHRSRGSEETEAGLLPRTLAALEVPSVRTEGQAVATRPRHYESGPREVSHGAAAAAAMCRCNGGVDGGEPPSPSGLFRPAAVPTRRARDRGAYRTGGDPRSARCSPTATPFPRGVPSRVGKGSNGLERSLDTTRGLAARQAARAARRKALGEPRSAPCLRGRAW